MRALRRGSSWSRARPSWQRRRPPGGELESQYLAPGAPRELAVPGVETHLLAAGVLARVATTETPQPILAVARLPGRGAVDASASLVLVADGVADPGNLGTMLRSAEASGADAVVTTPGTVDVFNPKVVRASAGAIFHVPVVAATLTEVAAAGLRMLGSSSRRGTPHVDVDWSGRVAIVVGSEAHGLDEGSTPFHEWITIDHRGRAESLNVAMAATILCFAAASARSR